MTATLRQAARKSAGAALSTALGACLLTVGAVATAPAAEAATTCGGTASIYGVLPDGRLTFSTITPATGALKKVRVGAELGFEPRAMATLDFNTVLVTSTTGALYRLDVLTNNESLVLERPPVKIFDSGWTHDKLTYDGHGHLYGTAGGVLLQYLVSQPKPTGSAHIGQRKELGSGFVLKTLTAAGDDRLLATTSAGALYSYKINADGTWDRDDLKQSGWSGFDQVVSPGGGASTTVGSKPRAPCTGTRTPIRRTVPEPTSLTTTTPPSTPAAGHNDCSPPSRGPSAAPPPRTRSTATTYPP
ncbi:hypothetical protein ACIPJK_14125 [Streptomyces roseus]|uniref:hypothetical protein n=1 Tax=Streptomyces roseus TaxID=66430 RepID=UPI003816E7A2